MSTVEVGGARNPGVSNDNENGDKDEPMDCVTYVAMFFSGLAVLLFFPFLLPSCIKIIQMYERGIIFRLGRVRQRDVLKPGVVFVFPCIDELAIMDVRTKCYATPRQKILTKDSVTVSIDAAVTFSVKNAHSLLVNRINLEGITRIHALTTLRDICGNLSLAEIIHERQLLSSRAKKMLQRKWSRSLVIKSLDIKNIELPESMVAAMASEALSTREGKANLRLSALTGRCGRHVLSRKLLTS